MTAAPEPPQRSHIVIPDHLLTVAEYAELGELEPGYSELVGGPGRDVAKPSSPAQQGVTDAGGPIARPGTSQATDALRLPTSKGRKPVRPSRQTPVCM
ncbi:hypothetical protein [Hoyosella subflava]|uniref:hypothetical protein n=1 Tax=Hoyosella subflava TaxID=639313 RepID=UPI0011D1F52B|nr:hypothetical protein [Hoyosella subflava]